MDATCAIQASIHVFSLVRKYVSRILGTYHREWHFFENVTVRRHIWFAAYAAQSRRKKLPAREAIGQQSPAPRRSCPN